MRVALEKGKGEMFYIEEFEIYESEGLFVAVPFDYEGGTQGESLRDASEMAWDWMRVELEYRMMHNEDIPEPTVGNEPKHGGRERGKPGWRIKSASANLPPT